MLRTVKEEKVEVEEQELLRNERLVVEDRSKGKRAETVKLY